jgi:peptide/nickel transport system substrate-binding protein
MTAAAVAAAIALMMMIGGGALAAPVIGGTLTVGLEADPTMLDPHASAAAATYLLGSLNVFESLLYQAPDGTFSPWLATSHRVSPDGKTFTFALRQDVRFSDGTPFNADAVKWNLDRIVNPNFRAGGSLSSLVGYAGSTVVDDHTVEVRFNAPYAPFLSYVAGGTLAMLSPKATAAQTAAQTQHAPVGSGPFTVAEYVTNDHVTFVRNAGYNRRAPWSDHQGAPYLDRIVWKIVPEAETRAITLSSGETQMVYILGYGTSGSILAQLRRDPRLVEDTRPFPGTAYLWLINVRRPPTDDLRVRRALLYGINRRAIIASVYRGLGSPACGMVSHVLLPDPSACSSYPYDPRRAAALLDNAGWKMGPNHVRQRDGKPLGIVINSLNLGGGDLPDIEPVQAQLLELGFDAKIKSQAFGPRTEDNFHCTDNLGTIFLRANDPDTLYALFSSTNIGTNFNWSCYANPDVDRMLAEGRSTLDPAKRRAIYLQLDRLLLDQAVAMPMMDELSVWVRRSNVQGVKYNYSTYPAFSDAYVTK